MRALWNILAVLAVVALLVFLAGLDSETPGGCPAQPEACQEQK